MHDAALGPPAQGLRAVLGDRLAADEDRVAAARPGLHEVGHRARRASAAAGSSCATSAPTARSAEYAAPRRAGHPGGPPGAARRPSPSSRSPPRSRRRGRGGAVDRAAVEEVPRQHAHRAGTLPACPATSSPAASWRPPISTTILDRAAALKAAPLSSRALEGRSVALLFQAPSTRTRLSFEAGVFELGGHPLVLRETEMQLSRGESLEDTARIFSRHVAAFGVRITAHAAIEELAACVRRARLQHAHRAAPSVPGARRPPDHARGLRARRGAQDRLRRRRQQRRPLAGGAGHARGRRGRGRLAARVRARGGRGGGAAAHGGSARGGRGRARGVRRRLGLDGRRRGRRPTRDARPSRPTGSTTRCSTRRRRGPSPCTACRRIPARRSRPRSSTGTASASGTRRRTAGTPRRRCWNGLVA